MVKQIDNDDDGTIDFDEFCLMVQASGNKDADRIVKTAFDQFGTICRTLRSPSTPARGHTRQSQARHRATLSPSGVA
jgi:hypothetical protein